MKKISLNKTLLKNKGNYCILQALSTNARMFSRCFKDGRPVQILELVPVKIFKRPRLTALQS